MKPTSIYNIVKKLKKENKTMKETNEKQHGNTVRIFGVHWLGFQLNFLVEVFETHVTKNKDFVTNIS